MGMDLIFARGVFLCFFYQNLIRLLFVLFLLRLRVAFQLSYVRRWTRFLFIIVYIGGVLVLAIYTILRSSNWKFPPIRGYYPSSSGQTDLFLCEYFTDMSASARL